MKKILDLVVVQNNQLSQNYCLLKLSTPDRQLLPPMSPGQFVEIKIDNSPTTFLRRPISVNFVDVLKNELWLLIQVIGDGTRAMSQFKQGDIVNMLLPLGNTFSTPSGDTNGELLLVGGGVGIAPMLFLGHNLHKLGYKPQFLLGARTHSDLLQLDEFAKYGNVNCTTGDGSYGEKGYVTNHSLWNNMQIDTIYTCGPRVMMQALAKHAYAHNIKCEVSLENLMACGFGVCLCCIEDTKTKGNICACTEGPVFNIEELKWRN